MTPVLCSICGQPIRWWHFRITVRAPARPEQFYKPEEIP
jgi:hypothetical protein